MKGVKCFVICALSFAVPLPSVSGQCVPPSSPITDIFPKNRYLTISAGDLGRRQAIRVTLFDLPSPYDVWNGTALWVQEPFDIFVSSYCGPIPCPVESRGARLGCEPFFLDWNTEDFVDVFDEGIVPGGTYHVQVIDEACAIDVESHYSAPLEMKTSTWGDVLGDCTDDPCSPPDGRVTIMDILGIVQRFVAAPGAPRIARSDLEPRGPDLLINITDALVAITAFQGLAYPYEPTGSARCGLD